jgi:hypothetical protein
MKTKRYSAGRRWCAKTLERWTYNCRQLGGGRGKWQAPLLCCLLALQLSEVEFGLPALRGLRASTAEEVPEIDSFSQPDLALSVLKHHSQNLFFAYTADVPPRNGGWNSGVIPLLPTMQSPEPSGQGEVSARRSLCQLRPQMREVYEDLLLKLLAVHYQNQSWNEFLDCYLELLAVGPNSLGLVTWTRPALVCSATCGRKKELVDALEHFARFSSNGKIVGRFQDVLELLHISSPAAVGAGEMPAPESYSLCVAANPLAQPMLEGH